MQAVLRLTVALLLCPTAWAQETKLPDPPQQGRAWKAPRTSLPKAVVAAAAENFELGLADPRDLDRSGFDRLQTTFRATGQPSVQAREFF